MRINGNKPKGKNTKKGKKTQKNASSPHRNLNLHPNFLGHATIAQFLKYFSLPFILFEP